MKIQTKITISESFKFFLQSSNYENAILDLMNRSKKVFPSQYARNSQQKSGECDFYNIDTLEKFEAKLPFDKKEGKLICSNNANLTDWIQFMMDEVAEHSYLMIEERGKHKINELRLYKTIDKRLASVQEDENAIFFFPFPIAPDGEMFYIAHICTDILSDIFSQLNNEHKIRNRNLYFIYPVLDQKIVLRCMNTGAREFLDSEEINKHIAFSIGFVK